MTTSTALHYTTLKLQLHYFTLQYTIYTTLRYTTLQYTTLQYTTVHYNTLQYTTIHYTNYTTPELQLRLHYTNYITLQLQHATTTPLHYIHYSYNYNWTTPHYIQQLWWGDHCNQCNHSKKHNSNRLSVHQWVRSAIRESQQPTLSYRFPIFETSATALRGTTGKWGVLISYKLFST